MTVEQLRLHYRARAFQPFILHIADGREVPVNHPEMMMIAPSGRIVAVFLPDDVADIIDILMITSVEVRPVIPGPGPNGPPGV